MPPLNSQEIDKFRAWLTDRVSHTCPVCGQPDWWTVQPSILVLLDIDTINKLPLDGPSLVSVTCRGCGVYLLFNVASIKSGPP